MTAPDEDHYWLVARRILDGYVIPFLGAGANMVERPDETNWEFGTYLPSGAELAAVLAEKSRYPDKDEDLLRVSQYVDALLGERALYQYLHELLNADYPPNMLHRLLARIPAMLRESGGRHQLVVTTNYDDTLERAFREAGEEFDLVWYEAKRGRTCGKFMHQPPEGADGAPISIDVPNEYDALSLDERTVILKLHGAVNRHHPRLDSFVMTEDDYIGFLSRSDVSGQLPVTLREAMMESHFLFLGYSMRDWNLRVILNRIWGQAPLDVKSWAVQRSDSRPKVNEIERKLWSNRGDVELFQLTLKEYVGRLQDEILALQRTG